VHDGERQFGILRFLDVAARFEVLARSRYRAIAGPEPVILHWSGTIWKETPGPKPAASGSLNSVAAISATNAWAAGYSGKKTMILRLNGLSRQ